jgi:hypothetical protein
MVEIPHSSLWNLILKHEHRKGRAERFPVYLRKLRNFNDEQINFEKQGVCELSARHKLWECDLCQRELLNGEETIVDRGKYPESVKRPWGLYDRQYIA